MTLTLHLGVVDVPYGHQPRGRRRRRGERVTTTGDVAEILEDKYHVMQVFFLLHERQIVGDLEKSLSERMESVLLGAPMRRWTDPFAQAGQDIQNRFHRFLYLKEMERLGYPGVPTAAALKGISHRRRHPYAKANPRRPSFVDTGLYESSFRAWVD